jgi:hypothetical protein
MEGEGARQWKRWCATVEAMVHRSGIFWCSTMEADAFFSLQTGRVFPAYAGSPM